MKDDIEQKLAKLLSDYQSLVRDAKAAENKKLEEATQFRQNSSSILRNVIKPQIEDFARLLRQMGHSAQVTQTEAAAGFKPGIAATRESVGLEFSLTDSSGEYVALFEVDENNREIVFVDGGKPNLDRQGARGVAVGEAKPEWVQQSLYGVVESVVKAAKQILRL